jgi:CspA family cold shock protein
MTEDRFFICTSCGTRFVRTGVEQTLGDSPPALCPGCRHLLPAAGRVRGLVKFYNVRKKWGFIAQPDGKEIFFHRSAMSPAGDTALREGDLVEYAVQATARGPQAAELVLLDPAGAGAA